jgi:phosphate-selective porin OprO/OprP
VTAKLSNATVGSEVAVSDARYKIGKGFTIASKDGRFSLQIRGRVQVRYDFEHPNVEDADVSHLAQVRRARLVLMGNLFSPHIRYYFQFGFSPLDMSNDLPTNAPGFRYSPLRDARVEFNRLRDFSVAVGQFKVPFSRQRVTSSSNMNMVDRSMVNAEFNLDRDIGIQVFSKDIGGLEKLAYYAGVFMGEGRNAFVKSDPGLLYVGRFEFLPFGQFDDYTEGDIARTPKPGMSIGAAYAFQDRAHAERGVLRDPPADGGTTDFHHFTADLVFKWRGLSLASAVHLRRGFNRINGGAVDEMGMPIPTVPARQGVAWYGQLGWVVPKIPLEFVGRYGQIRNIFGNQSSQLDADEAGGGINWYFVGHDLKLQVDYFRLWDETLGDSYADQAKHGLDRVRVQLQVYF